jgi:hypothetical protein
MVDLKKWENLHICFWLVKDTCWMLEWKYLGVMMIIPTVSITIYTLKKSMGDRQFYLNLGIFFWILANSFWMCTEFFELTQYKIFTLIPFCLGFFATTVFFYPEKK